jgi:outer membrane translocation and assembly module TamA
VVVANAEIRSKPIEILHVQLGAVAFYDVGDAFHSFSAMNLRQGAGGGIRLAFPQIQRSVFRIDVGVPLDPHDPDAETTILASFQVVAAFEQAFGVPTILSPGFQ